MIVHPGPIDELAPAIVADRYAAAVGVFDAFLTSLSNDELGWPSPCDGWTVRDVVNHVTGGSLAFAAHLTGGTGPDRQSDLLGSDPAAAFRSATEAEVACLAGPDALTDLYDSRLGPAPGIELVHRRTTEVLVHGWDISRAAARTITFDPATVEVACRRWRNDRQRLADHYRVPATDAQAAEGGDMLDALATLLGRHQRWLAS